MPVGFSLVNIARWIAGLATVFGLATLLYFSQDVRSDNSGSTLISDWAVAEGFGLEVHSDGFELPTTIAAVPNPGTEADAPLYYVGELNGSIKVVTRDGQVSVFATDFFDLESRTVDPKHSPGSGLAYVRKGWPGAPGFGLSNGRKVVIQNGEAGPSA